MLDREEFEAALESCHAFIKTYLESPETTPREDFYHKGMELCRVAIHVQEGRQMGRFDSRLHLFKLAEMMVEGSFLGDMSKLDESQGAPADILNMLTKRKFEMSYMEEYFEGNEYTAEAAFPNLWYGLDFAKEFLETIPTLDFTGIPKEIVGHAIGADLVKVTAMVLWATNLSEEHGKKIEGTQDILRQLYSIKYGVVLANFPQERVAEICASVSPWMKDLSDTVVGGRNADVKCLN